MSLVDLDAFRRDPVAHKGAALRKFVGVAPVAIDKDARTATFVISDGTPDREADVIDPKGWDFEQYKRNPVFLWAHNTDQQNLPIGKAVDGPKLRDDGKVVATFKFATHKLAEDCWQLVQDGTLNAVSVGFRPLVDGFKGSDRKTASGWNGIDFSKVELLEVSLVPVPCNPNAVLDGKSATAKDAGAPDILAAIKALLDAQTAQLVAAINAAEADEVEPDADDASKAADAKTKGKQDDAPPPPQKLSKSQHKSATACMKAASAMLALHHQASGAPDGEDDGADASKAAKGASPHRLTKSQMGHVKAAMKAAATLLDMHAKADGAPEGEPDDDEPPADETKGSALGQWLSSATKSEGAVSPTISAEVVEAALDRVLNKKRGRLE